MSHSRDRFGSADTSTDQRSPDSVTIPKPPRGKQRLKWVGPGFIFIAASAGGAGEILFPPRVGSLYGYAFVWAMITAVALKWVVNREIGRFAVCTGATLLDGFKKLPGPKNWAVWLIILPQLFVAVGSIAGLAGAAATAIVLLLPGDPRYWMIMVVLTTMAILLWGRYGWLEKISTVMASLLISAAIITAITVFPQLGELASGLVPSLPSNVDYSEILPWLSRTQMRGDLAFVCGCVLQLYAGRSGGADVVFLLDSRAGLWGCRTSQGKRHGHSPSRFNRAGSQAAQGLGQPDDR